MIQYLKRLKMHITLSWPFHSKRNELMPIQITERFDVVERIPAYSRIKFWFLHLLAIPGCLQRCSPGHGPAATREAEYEIRNHGRAHFPPICSPCVLQLPRTPWTGRSRSMQILFIVTSFCDVQFYRYHWRRMTHAIFSVLLIKFRNDYFCFFDEKPLL